MPPATSSAAPVVLAPTAPAPSTSGVLVEEIPEFPSTHLNNMHAIDVFLPPDYFTANEVRYKVLYANDGQDMPRLRLKQTLETLYAADELEKIIVVAIHATRDRLNEYGTAGIPNAQGLGARALEYSQFLTGEVMPYVNARYRTFTGPANTAIMGSSLGGLSAFDIAWNHPDLFGTIGVFSGSFWWRSNDISPRTRQASRIMPRIVSESEKREGLRMWFEVGTRDETADRDRDGIIDSIQDTIELILELERLGYVAGEDLIYLEVEGGRHNQETWARVLPDFLRWAFPLPMQET